MGYDFGFRASWFRAAKLRKNAYSKNHLLREDIFNSSSNRLFVLLHKVILYPYSFNLLRPSSQLFFSLN